MSFEALKNKIKAWLKLARPHFYPLSLVSYTIGAASANKITDKFDLAVYLNGFTCVFLIELGTVFCNEYFDYPTDRLNKNASLFTGGSRMLVNGKIQPSEIKTAILIITGLLPVFGYLLLRVSLDISKTFVIVMLFLGVFLGYGYTIPPLKLSYRGAGEITVAFTYGPYLILLGYVLQTNSWNNGLIWLISIPLFLAILPSIILAGIPDRISDKLVSKRTLSVIAGPKGASIAAVCLVFLAAISGILLFFWTMDSTILRITLLFIPAHAIILALAVFKFIRSRNYDIKINTIMILALTYILWFGLIPLTYFVWV